MVASAMPLASAVRTTVILLVSKYLANVLEQTGVDAVVEETVDLDDVAGQDSALATDALLKKLHRIPLLNGMIELM